MDERLDKSTSPMENLARCHQSNLVNIGRSTQGAHRTPPPVSDHVRQRPLAQRLRKTCSQSTVDRCDCIPAIEIRPRGSTVSPQGWHPSGYTRHSS
ncbi:hypothetical protein DOTSEDRAFT_143061 [Dothistroma septosporum NZE10]|uniref:Uncharacterized protein n=1 Tax=Dothistroma septosporum (strain NZE10 / CBS 128990) TaxID=675120 RepID=N1Q3L8_DOTSN|nr:hypothetical protein DOTSEDRAFT_143061 [Dothistroma septosporum NZE10]